MTRLDLSLSDDELAAYLATQRTIRLATTGSDGWPHVVPLWFVWLDGAVFLNTTLGNMTVRNLERDGRATGAVDDGGTYDELRGVVLAGTVQRAGDDPRLDRVKTAWSEKYLGGNPVPFDHWRYRVWLRLMPERIASWDFRKIPEARRRRG